MRTSEQVVSQETDLTAVPAERGMPQSCRMPKWTLQAQPLLPALISACSGARIQSRGGQWHRGQASWAAELGGWEGLREGLRPPPH